MLSGTISRSHFFGETNAGKSTLVETLRILFAEKTKQEIQAKFQQLNTEYSLDEAQLEKIKTSEKQLSIKENEYNQRLIEIDQSYTQKLNDYQDTLKEQKCQDDKRIDDENLNHQKSLQIFNQQIDNLKETVKYKKQNMSWLLKIIYIFKRLEEEKQIGLLELELIKQRAESQRELNTLKLEIEKEYKDKESYLSVIQAEYDTAKKDQKDLLRTLDQEKKTIKNQLQQFEKMLEELRKYEDGQIIGDGRSDFTRLSKEFLFDINGTHVKLIDVPGIEGDEVLVENEISKAVKRTHAVFYVTSKDAAPNEGTLTKIKNHLADQTEVWTIYNKPVTSPRSLKKGLVSNEDEQTALNALNDIMEKALGKNYRGYSAVAGLAAFYTVANCLEPFGEKYRNQIKFLTNSDRNELKEKSGLNDFQKHLTQKVIGDVTQKIKASNFNKANFVLLQTVDQLGVVHKDFSELHLNVMSQIEVTKNELDSGYDDLVQNLKSTINNIIQQFERQARQNIYSRIDKDISNDDFKRILKQEIDKNIELLSAELLNEFKIITTEYDEVVKQKLKKLSSRLSSLQNNFKAEHMTGVNDPVSLNFDIDNGINKLGLLGVGIGVAAAMWWNPVGWVAISLTAVGLIFSFAKAIWSFFDSDFKKSEQRKSVDKNLSNIVKELKKSANANIQEVEEKLQPTVINLKKQLNEPSNQLAKLVKDINESIKLFKDLSKTISNSNGVK